MGVNERAWKGESGLKDDYTGTITKAYFGRTSYNEGKTPLAIIEWDTVDAAGAREDHHTWFSIGETWEPSADGNSAVHESGNVDKNLNSKCAYMEFVKAALECGAPLQERMARPQEGISALVGLKFHMERKVTGRYMDRDIERELPTKFLGVEGGAQAATNGDAGTWAKAKALAAQVKASGGTFFDFVDQAAEKGLPVDHEALQESGAWSQ